MPTTTLDEQLSVAVMPKSRFTSGRCPFVPVPVPENGVRSSSSGTGTGTLVVKQPGRGPTPL